MASLSDYVCTSCNVNAINCKCTHNRELRPLEGVPASVFADDLQSARAEIERLKQSLAAEEGAHATDAKVAGRRADEAKAYRTLLDRAFRFLAGLSPTMNAPALSKEGKQERLTYEALMRELKQVLMTNKG